MEQIDIYIPVSNRGLDCAQLLTAANAFQFGQWSDQQRAEMILQAEFEDMLVDGRDC